MWVVVAGSSPAEARCTRTFRVVIFLLTPRKDGERSKGHGADCGKTLYRRLTVPNYAPEKGKGRPVCSTGSVGGCNDPQQAGNRLYMPPCGCTRRRRHKQRSEDVASGKDVLSLYGAGRGGGQGRTRTRACHRAVTGGRSRSTTARRALSYGPIYINPYGVIYMALKRVETLMGW